MINPLDATNRSSLLTSPDSQLDFHLNLGVGSGTAPSSAASAPIDRSKSTSENFDSKQHHNLRRRLLQTVLPTVLVPLAAANAVGYKVFQHRAEERVKLQLKDQALLASEGTTDVVVRAIQAPETIAMNPWVITATRNASQKAESTGLERTPIDQVEQRFKDSKLLQPESTLNDYLKAVARSSSIAELILTERNGFNIGYSNPTSDFVQRDEPWWQEAKKRTQWIAEPQFDQSANSFGVEVSRAILDPASKEFLGVVKAVVPAQEFSQVANASYLKRSGIGSSQKVQLLTTGTGRVITTIAAQTISDAQDVIGGKVIQDLAADLNKLLQEQRDGGQVSNELQAKYALQDLTIASFNRKNQQALTASLIHDGKQFILATIPSTSWVAVISVDLSEIAATGNELLLIFTLTFLLLSAAATAVILHLSRQLSEPLRSLSSTAEQIALGNLEVVAVPCGTQETQTLAHTLNRLVARLKDFLQEQAIATQQARLLAEINSFQTRTQQEVETLFNRALDSARHILGVDRIVVYKFRANWSGYISTESVAPNWISALNDTIDDACIPASLLNAYRTDRVVPTADVFNAGFHPEHLKLMKRLQIKANLVVPILHEGQLFALLIAHHCAKVHNWREAEISFMRQLSTQLGVTLDRLAFVQVREQQAERSQLLRDTTLQITQAETVEDILDQLPLDQVRQVLHADRVLVYRFDETWKGTVTAESVAEGFPRALRAQIHDPCFAETYVEKYKRGRVQATSDIYTAGLTPCHLSQLEPFAVRANVVAPIIQAGQLLGLLIAHQCSGPRVWAQTDIDLLTQVAVQVGFALDRCNLLAQKATAAEQARLLAEEQRRQKETLQHQLITLLTQIEGAAMGDLTVRAEVTDGEIGTVADFFNSIVESLRQIVTNVKQSALQVNRALGENEIEIRQLATAALKQAEETTGTLNSVAEMTQSIQSVAENARQAAEVASIAAITAEAGGTAMNLTVESIQNLRSTIGETAKKMKRLGESSQQISKVVSLIENIAIQTNLLALNASIEAARAGEQGQGFAVVAEEVGQLATKSAMATKEVEEIAATIRLETSQVVEAMEQSTSQVVEGTQLLESAKWSLQQILDVSNQIDQLVQSISEATVSQTQTSQAVISLMEQVAQVSQQTSESSVKVSGSLQSTVGIARSLQASVNAFKVETV